MSNLSPRRYPPSDIKLLSMRSAGYCAFPSCHELCYELGNDLDPHVITGIVAHIEAHSDNGPRANPNLTPDERDCYNNWIMLCPRHHTIVDQQPNTYTSENLRIWKTEHEQWVSRTLTAAISNITFVELEKVISAILAPPSQPSESFFAPNITQKMAHNGLTDDLHLYITLGLSKAGEVQGFIDSMILTDPDFPERLKAGFVKEYERLIALGYVGNMLFEELKSFSCNKRVGFKEQAAGLAVLSYLFAKCEVFEEP